MKYRIEQLVQAALATLPADILPADIVRPVVDIERTRDAAHGDFATNVALLLAKPARRNPRQLAQAIVDALPASERSTKVEIAGPGFINFHLSPQAYQQELSRIFALGADVRPQQARRRPEHGRRVRLGQSDRPAARRPRPAGGDRRRIAALLQSQG